MKCERCQIIKDEQEFQFGKEDKICESCVEEMLLGSPSSPPSFDYFQQPITLNNPHINFIEKSSGSDLKEYAHLSMGVFDPQLHYAIENERNK